MTRLSSATVGRWVRGSRMLTRYEKGWLRSDLVAGVVLAAILVPQGMAYAELAGLPAVNGLYTTVACLVGYAIFGPSRVLVLGPDSSLGPLIFAAILPLAVTDNPTELVAFAGFLALLVGAIEVGLGIGKLGFVADLLSKEVQVGYMMGLGVTIVVGQLPKLFGFSTDGDDFIEDVKAFVSGLDQRNRDTLIVGVAALALMLVLPRFTSRIPAVLITVILSTLAVSVFDLKSKGVTTVGSLPQGFPRPEIPSVDLGDVGALLAAAVGITLVSLADTIATSTSFAARRGDEVEREPGDGRDRRRQRLRRAVPGIPDLDQRLAHGRRGEERRQEPGDGPRGRRTRRGDARPAARPARRTCRTPRWRRS